MPISIINSHSTLQNQDIGEVERNLSVSFPRDYKDFLAKNNGGHPIPNAFSVTNFPSDTHAILDWFLCIDSESILDMMTVNKIFKGRIPKQFFAIGRDPGGNLICLSTNKVDFGKVYYWDHENELDKDDQVNYKNVYYIANSFKEFLDGLITLNKTEDTSSDFILEHKLLQSSPLTDEDYVWHHNSDGKTMQLIPFDLHAQIQHRKSGVSS